MVVIEFVEEDVFEYEQQKLKKNIKLVFCVIEVVVVFFRIDSLLGESKDFNV